MNLELTYIVKGIRVGKLECYLQNIYFLLHDRNPAIKPNNHNHELLDLNAYIYEPVHQGMQSKHISNEKCVNLCKYTSYISIREEQKKLNENESELVQFVQRQQANRQHECYPCHSNFIMRIVWPIYRSKHYVTQIKI